MVISTSILEWVGLMLGAAVAGALLGLVFVRWRLVRRVQAELGKEKASSSPLPGSGSWGKGSRDGCLTRGS